MFDTKWLIEQQDQLCSLSHTKRSKEYSVPDLSGFVPTPEKDSYFLIRQELRPDLHLKIYPNIPLSLNIKRKTESKKIELGINNIPNVSGDPYYHLRKDIDPTLHKQYYGE